MGAQWSQFFPPKPTFTDSDVSLQDGKVFIVTGGNSGIGFELAKMLYAKNARVYIAGRSEDKAQHAIEEIRASAPASKGIISFLYLALDDLSTIKSSVDEFKSKEKKLHVLWNNAGVSQPPARSTSKQGFELQLATNCLGPFLFTQLLFPLLKATAVSETETEGGVRVVWTASQMVELAAPLHGIVMSELSAPPTDRTRNYNNSKTGNLFLATEFSRRLGPSTGVISVATNPGAARTALFRHTPWMTYLAYPLLHSPTLAAYTQLYAGLAASVTAGCYVLPWGRISDNLREDLVKASKLEEEGGLGRAKEFWDFCEANTQQYS
ncbi:unnamed protein product [Discula destructiva]